MSVLRQRENPIAQRVRGEKVGVDCESGIHRLERLRAIAGVEAATSRREV
jgi:hypothetical protein